MMMLDGHRLLRVAWDQDSSSAGRPGTDISDGLLSVRVVRLLGLRTYEYL
jgi:hypothetical protein